MAPPFFLLLTFVLRFLKAQNFPCGNQDEFEKQSCVPWAGVDGGGWDRCESEEENAHLDMAVAVARLQK